MIKINLALKKSAALSAEAQPSSGTLLSTRVKLSGGDLNLNELREMPGLIWFFVLIGVYFGGDHFLQSHTARVIEEYELQIQAIRAEEQEVNRKYSEIQNLRKDKAAMEEDERSIRTKFEVLEKLVKQRNEVPSILLYLSSSIPKNVWIQSASLSKTELIVRGRATEVDEVYNYVKRLQERAFFVEVQARNVSQVKEDKRDMTSFEIVARRKDG